LNCFSGRLPYSIQILERMIRMEIAPNFSIKAESV
jgi:hypothetical protein